MMACVGGETIDRLASLVDSSYELACMKYVDVTVQRWQHQTGRTARLEPSGQTFSEMASKKMSAA
jgi:hypothetical protein